MRLLSSTVRYISPIPLYLLKYLNTLKDLHSLALEDILHERGHNHSKADYYPGHLFIRVLSHSLELEDFDPTRPSSSVPTSRLDLEGGGYVPFPPSDSDPPKDLPKYTPSPTLVQTPESTSAPSSVKGKERNVFVSPLRAPMKRFSGLSGFGGEVVSMLYVHS